MKKSFFIIFLCLLQYIARSQTTHIDHVLDSIINHPIPGKPQLIHIKNKVIVDTFAIKKVLLHKKDSSIIVKFSNKKSKKIKAVSIWGQVTDFGERRRFYNGKSYTIWRTKAPYIYRVQKNNSFISYYSESLTSNILLLNQETIETHISDSLTKAILMVNIPDYSTTGELVKNNILGNKPGNANELLKDIAETTKDITTTLFETLLNILNNELFKDIINELGK